MRYALVALVALAAIGLALVNADHEQDVRVEFDVIMSDTPLTKAVKNANLEGEHQANDMTTVIIIGIEMCNGVPM